MPGQRHALFGYSKSVGNSMKFVLNDQPNDVLSRLFKIGEDGRVSIGTAKSSEIVGKLDVLDEFTLFTDYLMEGFVSYYLRFSRTDDGTVLEVRFTETNRDQYIPTAIKGYIKLAGIKAVQESQI